MLRQVKRKIRDRLGPEPKDLARYGRDYGREFLRPYRAVERKSLIAEVEKSRMILGGDFHAFHQAQKTHLKILRKLKNKPDVLALECFFSEDQKWVTQFQQGLMTEKKFLKKIEWKENWGFAWSSYRPLVEWAKANGVFILALNRKVSHRDARSLKRRDQHAATTIAKYCLKQPHSKFYVVFGDLHLASGHLPAILKKKIPDLEMTILYQNSERIYMDLAKKNQEQKVNTVQLSKGVFCVLESPPWVKWQSFLLHLDYENAFEDFLDELDMSEQVFEFIKLLDSLIGSKTPITNFMTLGPGAPELWDLLNSSLNTKEMAVARELILKNKGFYSAKGDVFYFSSGTVNLAAGLVGQYIQAQLSDRGQNCWDMPSDFLRQIWIEGLGFLASKFINHHRKAKDLSRIKSSLDEGSEKTKEALLLALDYSVREISWIAGKLKRMRIPPARRKASYLEAAQILGSIFGQNLFNHYRSGRFSQKDMLELFAYDVESQDFEAYYLRVLKRVKRIPKVLTSERVRRNGKVVSR